MLKIPSKINVLLSMLVLALIMLKIIITKKTQNTNTSTVIDSDLTTRTDALGGRPSWREGFELFFITFPDIV